MMWLGKDQAWQHVVYEHARDADTETILDQFQCRSRKARESLANWLAMPEEKRRGCVLVHNASVRRVIVKTHLVNLVDGQGSASDWASALDAHPLGAVMKQALTMSGGAAAQDEVVIGAQRLAVVKLPPKPDTNWGWRGVFAYGDTKVGECGLREGGVFSFIAIDCGLRVGDREEGEDIEVDTPKNKEEFTEDKPDNGVAHGENGANGADNHKATNGDKPEPAEMIHETAVEVSNCSDEAIVIKVFEPGKGGHAARLFKSALGEANIAPGDRRVFKLKAQPEGETDFDVEVRIGNRKANCEVVGGQVVTVDGILAD
mmetsp:Transcript_53796/g.116280  ORF Transcript_53796/g.116280 Transcript_53796/m.116280 type:complete len:316 (+) Transcript_53796:3-950(+)